MFVLLSVVKMLPFYVMVQLWAQLAKLITCGNLYTRKV